MEKTVQFCSLILAIPQIHPLIHIIILVRFSQQQTYWCIDLAILTIEFFTFEYYFAFCLLKQTDYIGN